MSTVKQGVLVRPSEWRKHLRKWAKRLFWRRHRQAEQKLAEQALDKRDSGS